MGSKPSTIKMDKFDFFPEEGKISVFRFGFSCDGCGNTIAEKRFCCLTCSDDLEDDTFDLCAGCAERHARLSTKERLHRLCEAPAEPELATFPSFSHTLANRIQCHAFRKFIGTREDGREGIAWKYVTYYEVYSKARALSTFLNKLIRATNNGQDGAPSSSSFVAITAENRVDWVVADFAAAFSGAVSVPLHTTNGSAQLEAMLTHSTASICICDGPQLAKLRAINCPTLRHIICMDTISAAEQEGAGGASKPTLHSWTTALTGAVNPATWDRIHAAASHTELRTLLYTSGSTGAPKAAIMSDGRLRDELEEYSSNHVSFGFEPLAYASQRLNMLDVVAHGGRICFWDGDMSSFFDQLKATRLTYFSAPPRIWNILYSTHKTKVAIAEREGLSKEEAKKNADLYITDIFGEKCTHCLTGGAITAKVVLDWMRDVFEPAGTFVVEAYGITEAGLIADNGVRVMECTVHLEDVPELNYFTTDSPSRGLLWVHTTAMAEGYHGDPGSTAENFKDIYNDGRVWFNTGDIVEYDQSTEHIRVIDRKKNIVKLANSCFVAPEHLENVFIASPLVVNIWVHASSAEECIVVVVHPNRELLQQQSELNNVHFESYEELCSSAEAKRWVLQSLTDVGRAQGLQPYEIPRGVILEPEEWTPTTGELTASFKLSRIGLLRKYHSALDALYATLNDQQQPTVTSTPPLLAPVTQVKAECTSTGDAAVFSQIVSVVAKILCGQIDMSRTLVDLGVDSAAVMQFAYLLKAHNLQPPSIEAMFTMPLSRLMRVVHGDAAEGRYRIDWDLETTLAPDILLSIRQRGHVPPAAATRCVFLTGATGFLGSFILRDLLLAKVRVICLVRASSPLDAMARIRESAKLFATDDVFAAHEGQVSALPGDLSKELFSLSESTFAHLASEIDGIIHNGAHVSGVAPYSLLRGANVTSTLTCLRLAVQSGARLVYISSISSVHAPSENGSEDVPFPSPSALPFLGGYGASKRVSEILLCKAYLHGFHNIAIVRPGSIGPCPKSGCLSPNDTITRYLCSIVQLGIAPDIAHNISLCTVTDVSTLAVTLAALQPPSDSSRCPSFNVFGPSIVAIKDITKAATQLGWVLTEAPFRSFVERVMDETDPSRCKLVPIKSYFADGSFPMDVEERICGSSTAQLFSDQGLSRAIINSSVLTKSYQWLIGAGMLPPPPNVERQTPAFVTSATQL